MTYTIPPKKLDPKQRLVVVTDPLEIAAMEHNDLRAPIGGCYNGQWYATEHSLAQFRGKPVEFDV